MSNRHAINGKGKSNKHKLSCTSYKNTNKREDNKIKKLKKHCKKLPGDLQGINILKTLTV